MILEGHRRRAKSLGVTPEIYWPLRERLNRVAPNMKDRYDDDAFASCKLLDEALQRLEVVTDKSWETY